MINYLEKDEWPKIPMKFHIMSFLLHPRSRRHQIRNEDQEMIEDTSFSFLNLKRNFIEQPIRIKGIYAVGSLSYPVD